MKLGQRLSVVGLTLRAWPQLHGVPVSCRCHGHHTGRGDRVPWDPASPSQWLEHWPRAAEGGRPPGAGRAACPVLSCPAWRFSLPVGTCFLKK